MSEPNLKSELHNSVEEYIKQQQIDLSVYLHEEIDNINRRSWLFNDFVEWMREIKN